MTTYVMSDAIRFDKDTHTYWHGDLQLESVSHIISEMMPTDYSMIPAHVLENARLRGIAIDKYFGAYVKNRNCEVPIGESEDIVRRLRLLIGWWNNSIYRDEDWQIQPILGSIEDGVAGTADLISQRIILDLKVVSELRPTYQLQLGAYLSMADHPREAGIIHLTKDTCRFVRYERGQCREKWRELLKAWHERLI